ncbi:MAG: hypothetical protein RM368_06735 [Nostoc sp. DedSLP03]|nr:hypothetical protein [Nostoc sp. DedSLP03]
MSAETIALLANKLTNYPDMISLNTVWSRQETAIYRVFDEQ